ncbi:hypothetical protein D3C77_531290 [compost metagenome]
MDVPQSNPFCLLPAPLKAYPLPFLQSGGHDAGINPADKEFINADAIISHFDDYSTILPILHRNLYFPFLTPPVGPRIFNAILYEWLQRHFQYLQLHKISRYIQ